MSPISKSLTFGLVSALACTTAVASAQAQSTAPEIAVAVNKLARNLDPGRQTGNVDVRVYFSIYDTLIKRDFRNAPEVGVKLEPGLATSWSRPDARTLEVTLREAVVCHDGSPFNADDVVFTFSEERLWGAQSFYPRGRNYFSHLESVEKVDDRTVRFVTKAPDLILEERLTSYTSFIVCDEPWMAFQKDGVPFAEWMEAAFDEMKWAPVGTGPFKATGYRKNDFIRLEAHEGYWGGKPAVSAIEFKEVPEVSARIAGVVSGEYKMAVDIPPDQMQVVAGYDNVKSTSVSLDNTHVLVFNQADPVLADKNLRQAMSYAIDRDALRKALWNDENYTPNGHQLASFGAMYSRRACRLHLRSGEGARTGQSQRLRRLHHLLPPHRRLLSERPRCSPDHSGDVASGRHQRGAQLRRELQAGAVRRGAGLCLVQHLPPAGPDRGDQCQLGAERRHPEEIRFLHAALRVQRHCLVPSSASRIRASAGRSFSACSTSSRTRCP